MRSRSATGAALASLAAVVLIWPARAPAQVQGSAGGDLEVGYGYDTNLFLDAAPALTPGQPVATTPAADSFLHVLARPRLALRAGGHALDADYTVGLRQTISFGAIVDQAGRLQYRTPRVGPVDLSLSAAVERLSIAYAPEQFESFWLVAGEARLSAAVSATTRLSAGYRYAWRAYPDLALESAAGTQRDTEHSALLGVSGRPAYGLELGLNLAFAHNQSNDDRLDYERGRGAASLRWQARPWLALGADYALTVQYLPRGAEDPAGRSGRVTTGSRTDLIHGVGAQAAVALVRGVEVFVRYDGTFAWSTLDTVSYRRHVVVGGLRLYYAATTRVRATADHRASATIAPATQAAPGRPIRFRLHAPQARAAAVIGDFNGWDPQRGAMQRDLTGDWSVVLELEPGRHVYSFMVDGAGARPPGASGYVPDGFGGENGVIEVP